MATSNGPSYDAELKLELVQVIFRHGERMPMKPAALFSEFTRASPWDSLRTRVPTDSKRASQENLASTETAKAEEIDDEYTPNDLTTKGHRTTLAIGTHLRARYIDTLSFLPPDLTSSSQLHTRSSDLPRTIQSLKNVLTGLYPPSTRHAEPKLLARKGVDENLYPNRGNDQRLRVLTDDYQLRAVQKWAGSEELAYVNEKLKMQRDGAAFNLELDSAPRMEYVRDYIITKTEEMRKEIGRYEGEKEVEGVPGCFTDGKALKIMEKMVLDFRMGGFQDSAEVRALGVGQLLREMVERMEVTASGKEWEGKDEKMVLLGGHDTTIAAALISWEADREVQWPWFSSWLSLEMFSKGETEKKFFIRLLFNDQVVMLPRLASAELHGQKGVYALEAFVRLTMARTEVPAETV